jgi:hypothetical protein
MTKLTELLDFFYQEKFLKPENGEKQDDNDPLGVQLSSFQRFVLDTFEQYVQFKHKEAREIEEKYHD